MRRLWAIALLLGCGINEVGERDLDGSADVADVMQDVKEEPVVCADAGAASCADAVAFRSPALYAADRNTSCPSGYDTHDLVFAVPAAPLCACDCTDGGAPSCDTTNVNYHYGVGSCTTGGSLALSGPCTTTTQTTLAGESVQIDPPAPTGCGGGTSVLPGSTNTNVRLCTPQCTSDESVCSAANGLRACVVVVGSVGSCPPSYQNGPFYVGSNPSTTCDTCSCVATGDCTASTYHLYGNANCGGGDQSYAMDGTCHVLTGGQIGIFGSAAVKPSLKNGSCKVTQGSSHVVYGGNDFTVCCQ